MIQNKELATALAAADEKSLTALANKGIYKRACKDTEGMNAEYTEKDGSAEVSIGGETVTVCVPIKDSKCSCPSRTICRHIIGAVLLLKSDIPEDTPISEAPAAEPVKEEPPKQEEKPEETKAKYLSPRDTQKVKDCAAMCMELLGRLLDKGLVRIPDDIAESFELAAVRCHANKMADAERLMRELGSRIGECAERRASFIPSVFMQRMIECLRLMEGLTTKKISEDMLGDFRRTYTEHKGDLTLLPVGIRQLTGGEHEGEVYYFLDITNRLAPRFMSISNILPTYYKDNTKRRKAPPFNPWGLAVPLRTMMKTKMTLVRAKTCGGKLSSSQDTDVISHSKVSLNCEEVRSMLCDDFRLIAKKLSSCGDDELERIFFVAPESLAYSGFDTYTQTYIMTLRDKNGCRINAKVQYKTETKDLIDTLEGIAEKIEKNPEQPFTLLAIAYIEKGELTLFPIEIYDMIMPPETGGNVLSPEYTCDRSAYAELLLSLCDEIEDMLTSIVQFGLCSLTNSYKVLIRSCQRFGMQGLEKMLTSLTQTAAAYRHKTERDTSDILKGMSEVLRYTQLCLKRLDTVSAIGKMSPRVAG